MIPSNQLLIKSTAFVPLDKLWLLVDSLYGGTTTMREAGTVYLPKAAKETDPDYAARLQQSVLMNFYKQAVTTTTDLVYNDDITITNSTEKIDEFFDDVNAKGDNLNTFMREATKSAIHYGVSYIVCDYSRKPNEPEQEWDRPYWTLIDAPNMVAIESGMVRGVETITHIRFQETTTRSFNNYSGSLTQNSTTLNYGSTQVNQVRCYYLEVDPVNPANDKVYFEIYQRKNGNEEWFIPPNGEGYIDGINRIPFTPIYGNKMGFYIGSPLYMDLADINVRHWQSYSDQSNLLHYARFPILFASGIEQRDASGKIVEIQIGANTVLNTDNPDADLKFVSHDGKAVDSGFEDIDRLEDAMTIFGPTLAVNNSGGSGTATEWVLRASSLNSNLTALADATVNSLYHIMAFTLPYLDENSAFPNFEIEPKILNIPTPENNPSSSDDPASNTVNTVTKSGTQPLAQAASAGDAT